MNGYDLCGPKSASSKAAGAYAMLEFRPKKPGLVRVKCAYISSIDKIFAGRSDNKVKKSSFFMRTTISKIYVFL